MAKAKHAAPVMIDPRTKQFTVTLPMIHYTDVVVALHTAGITVARRGDIPGPTSITLWQRLKAAGLMYARHLAFAAAGCGLGSVATWWSLLP